jgi:hypothetical protein
MNLLNSSLLNAVRYSPQKPCKDFFFHCIAINIQLLSSSQVFNFASLASSFFARPSCYINLKVACMLSHAACDISRKSFRLFGIFIGIMIHIKVAGSANRAVIIVHQPSSDAMFMEQVLT